MSRREGWKYNIKQIVKKNGRSKGRVDYLKSNNAGGTVDGRVDVRDNCRTVSVM